MAGGEPIVIPLDLEHADLKRLVESCDAILLPGSKTDVDPAKYGAARHEKAAPADGKRDYIDSFLLHHADEQRKPVLGICYGLQSLNVYQGGTLVQHIPDFLLPELRGINHAAGRTVAFAHDVEIDAQSNLAGIIAKERSRAQPATIPVNSSHHQSVDKPGRGLRVVARCPKDGIIEALEGADPGHFVLAVQWHPERSVNGDPSSRAIFSAFVEASRR